MTPAGGRELRRQVGPIAWAVLADVLDDAEPDHGGRLVAATNVRRVAGNVGVGKDTAARALRRLVAAGLLERVPPLRWEHGRFGTTAYIVLCVDDAPASAPPAAPVRRGGGRRVQSHGQASLFEAP